MTLRAIRFCAFSQGEVVRRQTEVYLFFRRQWSSSPRGKSIQSQLKGGGRGEKLSLCVESPVRISCEICKIMCEGDDRRRGTRVCDEYCFKRSDVATSEMCLYVAFALGFLLTMARQVNILGTIPV